MEKSICPFLGLKMDPDSVLNFPSHGNCCHHAYPISPVAIDHQSKFCLTPNYLRCPVYISDRNSPLPQELVGKHDDKQPSKNIILIGTIISVLVIVFIVILFLLRNNGTKIPTTGQLTITATYKSAMINNATQIPQGNTTRNSVDSSSLNLTPNENTIKCMPPENWILYVVKPTDSLVRLALIFNITVEDLQKANCMFDRTLIKPGEEIFIPGATPTPTVSLTATPTNTRTYSAPIIPARTNTEKPQDPEPPRPTDPSPPTQPPPTSTQPPTPIPTTPPPPIPTTPPPPPVP